MKKLVITLCLVLTLIGCKNNLELTDTSIEIEPKFGGIYIHSTIEDFCALGFEYGDSIDIIFSNGFELIDIPFYDGYYTNIGDPLLVGYPGYPYIDVCYNNGKIIYEDGLIDNSMTATVRLKYKSQIFAYSTTT